PRRRQQQQVQGNKTREHAAPAVCESVRYGEPLLDTGECVHAKSESVGCGRRLAADMLPGAKRPGLLPCGVSIAAAPIAYRSRIWIDEMVNSATSGAHRLSQS